MFPHCHIAYVVPSLLYHSILSVCTVFVDCVQACSLTGFLTRIDKLECIDTSVTQELFLARHRDRIVLSILVNMYKRQKSNVLQCFTLTDDWKHYVSPACNTY